MHLSFVLLGSQIHVDGASILSALTRIAPAAPRPLVGSCDGSIAELRFADGTTTHVAVMPAPVPEREAEDAAARSLAAFSGAGAALAPHAAHLIVTTHGRDGDVETLVAHTRVVAACAQACGAIAVYEGNARATHPTAFYLDVVNSSDLPLMVWTGVSVAREADGRTSILTLGVENMVGMPDMLVSASPGGGNEALGFLFDILGYVVGRGAPLPDGDTVGRSAEEKLAVRYVPSPVDSDRRVARIDLP